MDDDLDFISPIDNVFLGGDAMSWTKPSPGYTGGTYWKVVAVNQWEDDSTRTIVMTEDGAEVSTEAFYTFTATRNGT